MKKLALFAIAVAASFLPVSAQAADTVTRGFVTTGSASAGTGSITFSSTEDSSLKMMVTAWQANQGNGQINAANLELFSGGIGITGTGDNNGAGNLHQIDNNNGYTDFLLLQFNRAVKLGSADLNLFQMSGVTGLDSDLSWFNAGSVLLPAQWNSTINLANGNYTNSPGIWTGVEGTSASGSRSLNVPSTTSSQVWLLGASQTDTAHNDGFKMAALQVTTPVPEPATWAMLIVGFGAIGGTLRRRRTGGVPLLA